MLNQAEAQVNKFRVKGVQHSNHCHVQLCCLGSSSNSLCFNLAPNDTQRYLLQYEDQVRRCTWPTFEDSFNTYTKTISSHLKCQTLKHRSDIARDIGRQKIKKIVRSGSYYACNFV